MQIASAVIPCKSHNSPAWSLSHNIFDGSIFRPDESATLDSRLTDNSQQQLIAALDGLDLADNDLPARPGFGSYGTPIKLRTNSFAIELTKPFYEYYIEYHSSDSSSSIRFRQEKLRFAELTAEWAQAGMADGVAHDHASRLISVKKLPQPLVINVPGPAKFGNTLTICYKRQLETQDLIKYVALFPTSRML